MLSNIIYLIIGALIGGITGFGFDWLKAHRESKRINKSVITLINLEIEKNKTLLKDFWEIVSKHESSWFENNQFQYDTLANVINDVPMPIINKIAWDKNFNMLPSVYKSKQLKSIWNTYENFELLNQLKEHLFFITNKSDNFLKIEYPSNKKGLDIIRDIIKSQYFKDDARELAQKFKEIIESLIGSNSVKFINKT